MRKRLLVLALCSTFLLPMAPVEAHRRKCLPGELNHRQCHRVWRMARNQGISKKYIRRKIWRNRDGIATVTTGRARYYGRCTQGCGHQPEGIQGQRVNPGCMTHRVVGNAYSLLLRFRTFTMGFEKRWCWNRRGRVIPPSKRGYVHVFYDITTEGVTAWQWKGVQDRYDHFRDGRRKHTSMRKLRMVACLSWGWPCFRDLSPSHYITSMAGRCREGIDADWGDC